MIPLCQWLIYNSLENTGGLDSQATGLFLFFLTPHPLGSFSLWRWWWWLFTLLSFLPPNYIIMYIFSLECFYIFEVELVSSEIYLSGMRGHITFFNGYLMVLKISY